MRNLFNLFAIAACVFTISCSKYDDSAIWEELAKHEERILRLETLCNQMNTNITSLQTIIIALQNNDYVTNIAPIKEGDHEIGYTITFSKSGSITIYHGKDGENGKDGVNGADGKDGLDGQDGVNGKDGKDGYTPKIGVKQHIDGKYYWTLDGNFLLDDNGNMIPTTGEDGANGADGKDGEDGANGIDGKDGITPQLKIEDGYWYLSHDDGASWQKLGKATGDNGKDGVDGDNFIESVTQDDDNVYLTLSEGQILTIKKNSEKIIHFSDINVKIICLEYWDTNSDCEISHDEAAAVTSLNGVFKGAAIVMFNELQYFTGLSTIEADAFSGCNELRYIILPDNIQEVSTYAFSGCSNLRQVKLSDNLHEISPYAFLDCKSLQKIHIPKGIKILSVGAFKSCSGLTTVTFDNDSQLEIIDGSAILTTSSTAGATCKGSNGTFADCESLESITLPMSLKEIGEGAFWGCTSLKHINIEDLINLKVIKGGFYQWSSNVSTYSCCGAFTKCTSLETIVLPESLSEMGAGIFSACDKGLKIYFSGSTPCVIDYYTFGQIQYWQSKQTFYELYVPQAYINNYKSADNWQYRTIHGY